MDPFLVSCHCDAVCLASDLIFTPGRCDPPLYLVVQYIEQYSSLLDHNHFAQIRLAGDAEANCDICTGNMRNLAAAAQIRQWWPWEVAMPRYFYVIFEILAIRTFIVSKRFVRTDASKTFWVICIILHIQRHIELLASFSPFYSLRPWYSICSLQYWARNMNSERDLWTHDYSIVAGWHNMHLFAMLPSSKRQLYA